MAPVRIALIGAGAWGRRHAEAIARTEGLALVGAADPNIAAARELVARYGGEFCASDMSDLLDGTRPDGVVVASPSPTHAAFAILALRRNIPVLIEKPVGISSAEVVEIAAAEIASQAFALPGHLLRFSRSYRRCVEIALSEIGRVLSVTVRRHRDESLASRYADTDPVLMTMIHDIDLAAWITAAEADRVFAARLPQRSARSETVATIVDTTGCVWRLATAWTHPSGSSVPSDRLEVMGDAGSVELEYGAFIRQFGAHPGTIDISAEEDPLGAELACFARGIRQARAPTEVTLADALRGIRAAEKIVAALGAA